MKAIDAVYKFGNLYDRVSKKRILIDDGAEISIVLNSNDLLAEDPNLKPKKFHSAKEKQDEVNQFIIKEGEGKYWKLFDRDKLLFFKISAGVKRKIKTEQIHCLFQLRLLEDLYIYNKKADPKYARFFDCHCLIEKCLSDFEFFEPIYATSLNDAYTKTYELYFAMFGKSTCNAFDRFSEKPDMRVVIRGNTESIQKTQKGMTGESIPQNSDSIFSKNI